MMFVAGQKVMCIDGSVLKVTQMAPIPLRRHIKFSWTAQHVAAYCHQRRWEIRSVWRIQ